MKMKASVLQALKWFIEDLKETGASEDEIVSQVIITGIHDYYEKTGDMTQRMGAIMIILKDPAKEIAGKFAKDIDTLSEILGKTLH